MKVTMDEYIEIMKESEVLEKRYNSKNPNEYQCRYQAVVDIINNGDEYSVEETGFDNDYVFFIMEKNDIKKKCLKIIKEKGKMNYHEIYKFFRYLIEEEYELVNHVYYVKHSAHTTKIYDNIAISMSTLIKEANARCDYPEALEGFLTDLTIECSRNKVDAANGFIFWQDENGFNYMENDEQITKHIIRWLKDTDFFFKEDMTEKLYKILTKKE